MAQRPAVRFAWFALLSLAAAWPYLTSAGGLNDFRDAHALLQYEDAARRSLLGYFQLPLWNPYYCGGLYGLGSPQIHFASPLFVLTLIFGTVRGETLAMHCLLLVGLEGTFRYLRSWGAAPLSALLAAPIFALSGIFACAQFLGWTNFYGFELLPWALWGVRRAARGHLRGAVIAAAAVALMTGFGGTYAVPIAAVACLFEVAQVTRRRLRPAALNFGVTALLAIGLSAYRLWPVWETLQRAPRVIGGMSGNALPALMGMLFGYSPPFVTETWFLVGTAMLPAAIIALVRRRSLRLAVGVFVAMWLALGYSVTPSLFAFLRLAPVYALLRSPERFLIVVALWGAVLAARGLTVGFSLPHLGRWKSVERIRFGWVALSLALVANAGMLIQNFSVAASKRSLVAQPVALEQPFHQARGNRWSAAYFAPMNRGSLSCWDAYPVPQSDALRSELKAEEFLQDPSAGSLEESRWSPNKLELVAHLTRPTRVIINQNHHTGWRANVGTVVSDRGLLAVDLPAGEHALTLRFLPRSALGGGAISLTALVAIFLLWRRRELSAGQASALAASPLLVGLLALLIPEPQFQATPIAGPAGEELVADAPPRDAQPTAVTFEGGVTLEAASVTPIQDGNAVRLELDWRVVDPVAPRLGVFVHIQPDTGDRIAADHAVIDDGLFLEEAPRGKTVRDIQILSVSPAQKTKTWKIWVGLWAVRGDGNRMKVLSRGNVEINEDRVLAGTVTRPPP